MIKRMLLPLALALCACAQSTTRSVPMSGTMSGLDVLAAEGFKPLRGKRVGVISNRTGMDRRGRSIVDLLGAAPGVRLVSIFSPEHGFFASSESENIGRSEIAAGDRTVEVISLYSGGIAGMRPKLADLQKLDVLIFDIQDVGARFYTYLATMAMALEEAKKANIDFMILDRPNPIRGDIVEGPILEDSNLRLVTPTAYFMVPVRHGLTPGEMALWHNRSVGHPHLTVVKLRGWKRSMWYEETGLPWVAPSPNMPDVATASLYPGIGIFEASNLSVGRGTPAPLSWIGAPWLKAADIVSRLKGTVPGVEFAVADYTPTKSVFAGQACHGVKITITDRDAMRPLIVFRRLALVLRELHPKELEWKWDGALRMVGTEDFHRLWDSGAKDDAFTALFDKGPRDFEPARRAVLLY